MDTPFEKEFDKQKTKDIKTYLKTLTLDEIAKAMKIKKKLLSQTMTDIHLDDHDLVHGISMYFGLVFKEIAHHTYDFMQLDYLEYHLRILSAMYGIVTPFTGVQKYRLDFTMSFDGMDLYDLWREDVTKYFVDEDVIVNLASVEFSSLIDRNRLSGKVLDIFFYEEQPDGRLKIVTVRAKMMRGLMVDFMARLMVEDYKILKTFSEMGYSYSDHLSKDWKYVYVRPFEH